jgi:hypothetical protein
MIASPLLVIALLAQVPPPAVDVAWPVAGPLAVACPVGQATWINFPEPLRRLRTFGPDRQAIVVTIERAAPTAIVVIRPQRHPARSGIEFQGATLTLRLDLTSTATGPAQGLRLNPPAAATAGPDSAPPSTNTTPPPTTVRSLPAPPEPRAAPTPRSAAAGDGDPTSQQLPWARAEPIGRREGLPGQPALVLEDALRSEDWTWYRLRLEGGAREQITALEWERGPISDYQQRSDGADRRILVRLPRPFVGHHTRLVLKLASGPVYRVAPFPPTLSGFFKRLFR